MSTARRLRAAVIGTGFVGPHHVDAVQRGGYATVEVLVDRDPERGLRLAQSLGVARAVTEIGAVLRDPSIDVVHVCTPNWTHVDLARAAMEAGKHVVVEKPIAIDRAGAATLLDVAQRTGRHGATALTYRGYPMVRQARQLVASGRLGELRLAHGAYLQDWLSEPADYNWRVDATVGGPSRAFADIGTHWFDTVEFIAGARVMAVMADVATLIPIRQRPTRAAAAFSAGSGSTEPVSIDTEDAATVLLRFADGARGSLIVSQVSPGHRNFLSVEISGSDASLRWEQEQPERLWLGSRRDSTTQTRAPTGTAWPVGVPALPAGHPEGWGEALRDLLRPFYAAIAAGEPPPDGADAPYPTLADGARGVALIEAVLESSKTGKWVEVRAISP
jgi:predicted dehydrogenase